MLDQILVVDQGKVGALTTLLLFGGHDLLDDCHSFAVEGKHSLDLAHGQSSRSSLVAAFAVRVVALGRSRLEEEVVEVC